VVGYIRLMLMFSSFGLNILLLRQLKRQRRDAVSAVITALLRALVRYRVASPRGIAVVRAARPRRARLVRARPRHAGGRGVTACGDGDWRPGEAR
ncbi:MAG: FUSC family protein, partial [Komagataeibacter rhaeticus]